MHFHGNRKEMPPFTIAIRALLSLALLFPSILISPKSEAQQITPVDPPKQFDRPQLGAALAETTRLIQADLARMRFEVDGSGLTVAVLDTGLRTTHTDFAGKVLAQKNFTSDNGGNPDDASDGNGHGTNVGGIIVANDRHIGIAPKANIIPLKVLPNNGPGSYQAIEDALKWVRDNNEQYNITVVNMSLGDSGNYRNDDFPDLAALKNVIAELRTKNIAVVAAAGNDFARHQSKEGMSVPAVFRETVSAGAVYDSAGQGFQYPNSGAIAFTTNPDQITPFSQRLHGSTPERACRTDIFAPGAPVTSSGINTDIGQSIQHGTSQATPVTAGVILLLQQYFLTTTGQLPTVDDLERWLFLGGVTIKDEDPGDKLDNVKNTGKTFVRLDALGAMMAANRDLQNVLLLREEPIKEVFEANVNLKELGAQSIMRLE